MKQLSIGFDVDNTIAKMSKAFLLFHNGAYGTDIKFEDLKSHSLSKDIDITFEEELKRFEEFFASKYAREIEPVQGAQEAVKKLAKDHKLYVITSRPEDLKEQTQEWVDRFFKDLFQKIFFTYKDYTKAEVCVKEKLDLMIDDHPLYCQECAEAGITVLIPDRPWNKHVRHEKIIRVDEWKNIPNEIEKLSNQL